MIKIDKVLLPEYSFKHVKVYTVDANKVNKLHNVDFGIVGHPMTFAFIPVNPYFEFWINNKLEGDALKLALYHGLIEARKMIKGFKYEDAHKIADVEEYKALNCEDFDDLIKTELKKDMFTSREPSIYNGVIHNHTHASDTHHLHKQKRNRIADNQNKLMIRNTQ